MKKMSRHVRYKVESGRNRLVWTIKTNSLIKKLFKYNSSHEHCALQLTIVFLRKLFIKIVHNVCLMLKCIYLINDQLHLLIAHPFHLK